MSEKKKAEKKVEKTEKKVENKEEVKVVSVDDFIARKLKVINELPNKAKAKALADRVLRNKEVKY